MPARAAAVALLVALALGPLLPRPSPAPAAPLRVEWVGAALAEPQARVPARQGRDEACDACGPHGQRSPTVPAYVLSSSAG